MRPLACRAFLVLSVVLAATGAGAQTVDEIVEKHLVALGGRARLDTFRSLRISGRAIGPDQREALIVREVKRPGRVRTEFTFQGITGVFAYDGKRGWQISPLTGIVEPQAMDPANLQVAIEQGELDGPLVTSRARGSQLTLVGRETVSGRDTYHLRLTPKAGLPEEFFLDAETYLVLRRDTTRVVQNRRVTVEATFADYRTVGGQVLPHAMDMGVAGRPDRLRVVVDSVEINPPIADSRFAVPRGTRR
jgi:outer membrane lipoprotein-sorting protein